MLTGGVGERSDASKARPRPPTAATREDRVVEEVLVVPRAKLFAPPDVEFRGFRAEDGEGPLRTVGAHGRFVLRDRAEPDRSLKQIIPYGVIVHDGAAFLFWRSRKGGEERLHDKASLGVGGHVNPGDLPPDPVGPGALRSAVERAFLRELREEVDIGCDVCTEIVGVLNDDSNLVGSVHFGIVYVVRAEAPLVRVREEDLLRGSFIPVPLLEHHREAMETWSSLLLDHLPLLAARAKGTPDAGPAVGGPPAQPRPLTG